MLLGELAFNPLTRRIPKVNSTILKLYVKFQDLCIHEAGQDLVEYVLVVALLCFGATSGIKFLAVGLSNTFNNISTTLGSYIS
jgi:Flp pilus assembly pilin Flp